MKNKQSFIDLDQLFNVSSKQYGEYKLHTLYLICMIQMRKNAEKPWFCLKICVKLNPNCDVNCIYILDVKNNLLWKNDEMSEKVRIWKVKKGRYIYYKFESSFLTFGGWCGIIILRLWGARDNFALSAVCLPVHRLWSISLHRVPKCARMQWNCALAVK